ncbi:MAG TPA: low temperature requirement protein A [Polyangiales bacterium]|nr:low temperature requirement protein A [Polyangiales bacterium]
MVPRDPTEHHRVATPLELLFDLCFVVAIAQAAAHLHHAVSEAHLAHGLIGYLSAFFAIWWAWMNLTWFASAFDCDDVPYRLLVLLQIGGVLVLAAGVPRAFDAGDFTVITIGYAIIRVAMIALWLRAALAGPTTRVPATRYALGIGVCQIGWISLLFLPENVRPWGFPVMVVCELIVPIWAERTNTTAWHPHHIAERYGLLTLIVLGESVLSATQAVQMALDANAPAAKLLTLSAGGLLILASIWWIYFAQPAAYILRSTRTAFVWGYGHFAIFASLAAIGAGLAVVADHAAGKSHIERSAAGAAVAVPVAVHLMSVWFAHVRPHVSSKRPGIAFGMATIGVLLTPLLPAGVLIVGLILAALVAGLPRARSCATDSKI